MENEGILDFSEVSKETFYDRVKEKSSSHDITIHCSDGEIKANKMTLLISSNYFESLFEKQGNTGNAYYQRAFKKSILEVVISYLLYGQIDLTNLNCLELMDFMEVSSEVGINNKNLIMETEKYLLRRMKKSPLDVKFTVLIQADKHLKFLLVDKIISKFELEFLEDKDAISNLPLNIAMRLFAGNGSGIVRLAAFHKWLQKSHQNQQQIDDDEKKKIIRTFDTKLFTKDDIIGVVKDSGFYSNDELLNMMGRIIEGLEATCSSLKRKGEYFEEEDEVMEIPCSPKKRAVEVDLAETSPLHPRDLMDKEKEEENSSQETDSDTDTETSSTDSSNIDSSNTEELEEGNSREIIWEGKLEWCKMKDSHQYQKRMIPFQVRKENGSWNGMSESEIKWPPSKLVIKQFLPKSLVNEDGSLLRQSKYLTPHLDECGMSGDNLRLLTEQLTQGQGYIAHLEFTSKIYNDVFLLSFNHDDKSYKFIIPNDRSFV